MARVLISVRDPLGLDDPVVRPPALLIDEYVRVTIQGKALDNVYAIPRSALHDGNTLWLVSPDDTLAITSVDVVWGDDRIVLVRDTIRPGDRLIISDLATPVTGMPVEVIADPDGSPGASSASGDHPHG
jgi:multidrug efflux pump subunit AcrA (membrane-fusion protein)